MESIDMLNMFEMDIDDFKKILLIWDYIKTKHGGRYRDAMLLWIKDRIDGDIVTSDDIMEILDNMNEQEVEKLFKEMKRELDTKLFRKSIDIYKEMVEHKDMTVEEMFLATMMVQYHLVSLMENPSDIESSIGELEESSKNRDTEEENNPMFG